MFNPDPKKYVIRRRKNRFILVDKQVIRWQKERRKQEAALLEPEDKPQLNLFQDDTESEDTPIKSLFVD